MFSVQIIGFYENIRSCWPFAQEVPELRFSVENLRSQSRTYVPSRERKFLTQITGFCEQSSVTWDTRFWLDNCNRDDRFYCLLHDRGIYDVGEMPETGILIDTIWAVVPVIVAYIKRPFYDDMLFWNELYDGKVWLGYGIVNICHCVISYTGKTRSCCFLKLFLFSCRITCHVWK